MVISPPEEEVKQEPEHIEEKHDMRRSSRIASQKYSASDLYKPKPIPEGSTIETVWGSATVQTSRINGDLELTWPGHDEAP